MYCNGEIGLLASADSATCEELLHPPQSNCCYYNERRGEKKREEIQSLTHFLPQDVFMTTGTHTITQLHHKAHGGLETFMWFDFTVLTGISDPKLTITRAVMETKQGSVSLSQVKFGCSNRVRKQDKAEVGYTSAHLLNTNHSVFFCV